MPLFDRGKAERDALQQTLQQCQAERDGAVAALWQCEAARTAAQNEIQQRWIAQQAIQIALEQAQAEVQRLRAVVEQPLYRDAARLHEEVAVLEVRYTKLQAELQSLEQQRATRQQDVVVLEDMALLQSFGLYTPRYPLQRVEDYKARLDALRASQEEAVRRGQATISPTQWMVNDSKIEGARMIADYTKLILRSFNNECDTSISGVKFSNLDATEKRIRKAFATLNALAKRLEISLTDSYLALKIEELYLYHEYQVKKQEEKEEQKLIREQLREEAKAQRDIEELKAKLVKEQRHFAKALTTVGEQLQRASSEAERALLQQEQAIIQGKLAELDVVDADIQNRERNTRAGYVYVISNLGAFGENVYKIGVTRRLDPQDRIDELGDASVPFSFDVHALIFSDDAPALENALHRAFEHRRLNRVNRRREFFHVSLDEVAGVLRQHFNKPVELTLLADATEYRQSLLLRDIDPESAL